MVFDGYDATSAVTSSIARAPSSFQVFLSGFGLDSRPAAGASTVGEGEGDQPAASAFALSGGPKVLFEMHLHLSDNTSMVIASHRSSWEA